MKKQTLICDRCGADYSAQSQPVENFNIKVGGHNYVEDFICQDKDYCRECIGTIRSAITAALRPTTAGC